METQKIFYQILSVIFFPGFFSRAEVCIKYSFSYSVNVPITASNRDFFKASSKHENQYIYPLLNFRVAINLTPNNPQHFFDDLGAHGSNDKDVSHKYHHDGNHVPSQRLGSGGGLGTAGGNTCSLRARTDLTYNLVIVPGSDPACNRPCGSLAMD